MWYLSEMELAKYQLKKVSICLKESRTGATLKALIELGADAFKMGKFSLPTKDAIINEFIEKARAMYGKAPKGFAGDVASMLTRAGF